MKLDWTKTGVGAKERNALYVARDMAVLERAYPGLTPERAMQTDDRREYEASFVIDYLRRAMGKNALSAIIGDRLSPALPVPSNQTVAHEQSRSSIANI